MLQVLILSSFFKFIERHVIYSTIKTEKIVNLTDKLKKSAFVNVY